MYPMKSVTHVARQRDPVPETPQILFTLSCGHRIRRPGKGHQLEALRRGSGFQGPTRMRCRHCES